MQKNKQNCGEFENFAGRFSQKGELMMSRYIFLSFALMFLVVVPASWGADINVNCPGQSLQDAITAAGVGTNININGICNENILIDNDKIKLGLFGSAGATINGPDPNKATFDIRGKAIQVYNLNITGGSNGIHVQRGSNAFINSNDIHGTGNQGIIVGDLAFAVIFSNNIHDNAGDGILVLTNSTAHIGFNNTTDPAPSPNTIQNNGGRGIDLSQTASARIYGNIIQNNTGDGIGVFHSSHGDISTNTINGNGGNGINVSENSSAQLGEDNPVDFTDQPNITTVNNQQAGIRCTLGGIVRGHLGNNNQINGNAGQFGGGTAANLFSNSCPGTTNGVPNNTVLVVP